MAAAWVGCGIGEMVAVFWWAGAANAPFRLGGGGDFGRGAGDRADGPLWPTLRMTGRLT